MVCSFPEAAAATLAATAAIAAAITTATIEEGRWLPHNRDYLPLGIAMVSPSEDAIPTFESELIPKLNLWPRALSLQSPAP